MGAGFGPHEGSVRGTVLEESLYSRGNYLDDLDGVADTLRNFPRDRAAAGQRSPDRWFKPVLDGVLSSLKGSKNFGALDRSIHTRRALATQFLRDRRAKSQRRNHKPRPKPPNSLAGSPSHRSAVEYIAKPQFDGLRNASQPRVVQSANQLPVTAPADVQGTYLKSVVWLVSNSRSSS